MLAAVAVALGWGAAVPSAASPPGGATYHTVKITSGFVAERTGGNAELTTRVRVPAGPAPDDGWPVVYLFHGHGEDHSTWTDRLAGDLESVVGDLPAVVVMPDARDSWLTDHHGVLAPGPAWTRYVLEELVPTIDERFPVTANRRRRVMAGASMGGMGAALLAAQRPDQFGTLVSLSGSLDHRLPYVAASIDAANAADGGYTGIFGPRDGHYAVGHNPADLTANLTATRAIVLHGDGTTDPEKLELDRASVSVTTVNKAFLIAAGPAIEVAVAAQAQSFVAAARRDGVPVVHEVLPGAHDWPYLRRQLGRALEIGVLPGPPAPTTWTYRTARAQGRAWDFDYAFGDPENPPRLASLVTFRYAAGLLTATGTGTVTITGRGCSFTATLPFARRCSAEPSG